MISICQFDFNHPRFKELINRYAETPHEIIETVTAIVLDVKQRGDAALCEYMLQYDGIDLSASSPLVSDQEFETALAEIDPRYSEALKEACDNLFKFHQYQLPHNYRVSYPYGVVLERKTRPVDRVGICVPAAAAPLSSSLYMNLIPALVAGVPEISIIASPGKSGIDRTILYVADFLGIRKVYKISGAQGVAALAYGTESIPPVDKIVGPGSIYVQTAKRIVHGTVGTDSFAGPSEIAIIADNDAPEEFIAADMLSQAEHGTGFEASIVFCLNRDKAEMIRAHAMRLIKENNLESRISQALQAYGNIFIVDSIDTAVAAVNLLAPEHVEIMCKNEGEIAGAIINAGAVFIGRFCPESVGDYYCGTNHILPTGGTARFSSGLTVLDFMRGYSVVRYTEKALATHGSSIQILADQERMQGHSLSISVRKK